MNHDTKEPLAAAVPRQTWYPHRNGLEWAQYEWESPQAISECRVFWLDDNSVAGGCGLPLLWRLLYREASGAWMPVDATIPAAERGKWSVVQFPAVWTGALRISLQCAPGKSASIRRWMAIAASPKTNPDSQAQRHPDLFLGDLSPLHSQVGWDNYRVNCYDEHPIREGFVPRVNGKDCSQYLYAHASSRIEFAIPEGYVRFRSTGFGPTGTESSTSDHWILKKTWKYMVQVDGKTVFESRELNTYPGGELPIDLPLPRNSRKLTLLIDSCGSKNSDHAFWGFPTLSADEQGHAKP